MGKTVELIEYLNNAKSSYHTVSACEKVLMDNDFKELHLSESLDINPGRYFIKQSGSSIFAFVIPEKIDSVRIAMAHTDYPSFKLKPVATLSSKAGCKQINVEPYGGSLKRTWFDRPLGIAGIVMIKTDNPMEPECRLFDSEAAWITIPSLAPHMDRDIEKRELDIAKEMNPVIALAVDDNESIMATIADKSGCSEEDILSFDLNLYDVTKAQYVGTKKEFIQSKAIDNTASCGAIINALVETSDKASNVLRVAALFDNEEIGSRTRQGADSNILYWILTKLCMESGIVKCETDMITLLSKGILLSCDGAHAVHPNYSEKADSTSVAELGKGIVIKTSASQRYVTDPKAMAVVKALCEKYHIKYQLQANKSGTPGGQTLGPIASSYIPVMAVDMGVPMLAMHSINEMIAANDFSELEKLIGAVYSE